MNHCDVLRVGLVDLSRLVELVELVLTLELGLILTGSVVYLTPFWTIYEGICTFPFQLFGKFSMFKKFQFYLFFFNFFGTSLLCKIVND